MNKKIFNKILTLSVFLAMPSALAFANDVQTVSQVTSAVNVSDGIDYHITDGTPFAKGGSVNLTKDGDAVVILDNVRPSKAVNLLGDYVKINGEKAVRGTNCDIRIHADGTIIYPYTEKDAPLTVYSGQNYTGTSVSDFGLEDNGGFMNTLTDAKLNNKIRSFKLRRGFMVTFSTLAGGYGYSRCFIAGDKDLDMATLPAILDKSITSYRIFKWNDTGKKGLGGDVSATNNNLLNTTSCFTWGNGEDTGLDRECVRHHIHEAWPSIASIGGNDYTTSAPTVKTNNEPGNSSDDNPATVDQVLANWQQLMATGKRLCSPSSHDGSLNWLRAFMDSVDARGWRCDVLDLHCYWPEGSFNNLQGWYNSYHRPIWISEWCWGASWNNNGAFASGVTEAQNATHVKSIIDKLESWDYVERYFYWNSERDPSRLVKNGALTAAGREYANEKTHVGYNEQFNYAPKVPKSKGAPSNIAVNYDIKSGQAVITWHEPNGEYNASMTIERQLPESGNWETAAEIDPQEQEADYTYTLNNVTRGTKFRIHTVYADGTEYNTKRTPEAVPEDLEAGQALEVNGETLYAGANIIDNGDFSMGLYGWTSGDGTELSKPAFQAVAKGGRNNKSFLQAYSAGNASSNNSVLTTFDIQPNATYYFSGSVYFPNGSTFSSVILSGDGLKDSTVYTLPASEIWRKFGSIFNSSNYSKCKLSFRWLASTAAYGDLSIQRLYKTREEALADAATANTRRASLEAEHPTFAQKAAEAKADSTAAAAKALQNIGLTDTPSNYTFNATNVITEPEFAATNAVWQRSGTFTGGQQGNSNLDGKSCWSARWTDVHASEGKAQTMGVRQQVSGLTHGVYVLSVDAATDHYCISDQHGYMTVNGDSLVTPNLTLDLADLPLVPSAEKWQTLATDPVYLDNNTSASVGFVGSKDGAVDNAYKPYGDQRGTDDLREGSWYATNFRLVHLPVYRMKADEKLWRGLCMPYALKASDNLRLFTIAGKDAAGTTIYLNEVSEVAAGVPCIALPSDTTQMIIEEGSPVSTDVRENTNGLRGYLNPSSSSRAGRNSLVLKDGYWQTQTSTVRNEREHIDDYMAIIPRLSDVPVIDTPTDIALGIDQYLPTGINAIENETSGKTSAPVYFDLNGRRVSKPAQNGVYIKVQGDKAEKVIVR